jgi:CRISPR/Cas system-associated endonuclease Cas3-HD
MSDQEKENIFKDLIPHAKKVLHQRMMDQSNPKLAIQVAESILDRAGETKKQEERVRTPIVISNSQVAILTAAAEEVEKQIALDGGLYEPSKEELENAGKAE